MRLAIAGGLAGFPGLGVWVALLPIVLFEGALSPGAESALVALVAPLTLAISIALPPLLLRMRQPRPARVTWDAWGIVEHDGASVRTAIPWRDARARVAPAKRGRVLQITDADGRAITVASIGAAPRWLSRRKATASDAALEPLARAVVDLEEGPEIAPDARDARRPTMGPQAALSTIVLGLLGAPTMWLAGDMRHLVPAFAALVLCMLCAAPALRPIHELLELLAVGRRFDRAEEATIEDGEGTEALLRRRDGSLVRVDVAAARHADALLATREGTVVHVQLPAAGWAPAASRVDLGPAVAAEDVETAHEREARAELTRAARIELAARGAAVLWWGLASLSPIWR